MTMPVTDNIGHFDLCKSVAEWAIRKAWVTLYEYQSYATDEFPDVLVFSRYGTTLYEIKTSRSDFLADAKKEARRKWRPKVGIYGYRDDGKVMTHVKAEFPELYYIQHPHLGSHRYFVCEPGIIEVKDLPEGWGLYHMKGGRMFEKAQSKRWRPDVHMERNILAHALRRFASGDTRGILVSTWERSEVAV